MSRAADIDTIISILSDLERSGASTSGVIPSSAFGAQEAGEGTFAPARSDTFAPLPVNASGPMELSSLELDVVEEALSGEVDSEVARVTNVLAAGFGDDIEAFPLVRRAVSEDAQTTLFQAAQEGTGDNEETNLEIPVEGQEGDLGGIDFNRSGFDIKTKGNVSRDVFGRERPDIAYDRIAVGSISVKPVSGAVLIDSWAAGRF